MGIRLALAALALSLASCKLLELHRNVQALEQTRLIGGHVSASDPRGGPVIAVLVAGDGQEIVDEFVLAGPGAFYFVALPGVYRVAAFEDRNRDFTYQPADEPAAWYGAPDAIEVVATRRGGVDLRLPPEPERALGITVALSATRRGGSKLLPPVTAGDVVALDDPRFAPKNGQLGLWQPVDFMFQVEAGFYFLEPYDPDKTPVLFVHGAGGTPLDFAYLIEHLDRRRFQPWLMYYPTGLELDQIADSAVRWLDRLIIRYDVDRMAVVAHSMGGLVSRAMLNRLVARGDGEKLSVYVTLSTPWGGFASAESGVANSPVVMPMWRSMAPSSAFLADLFVHPLPCPHDLLFSYRGRTLLAGEVANDGVVAVSSEIPLHVQEQARRVYGFDHSHMGILNAPEVSALVNRLLAGAEDERR